MWWWVSLFSFLLSGCGYTLNHRLKDSFAQSRGLFVPVFDNETDETGAERVFTNALLRELQSRGEIVLTGRDQGALELRGTLRRIEASSTALTDWGFGGLTKFRRLPAEIGVTVTIALSLFDAEGKPLWTKEFSGFRREPAPVNRTRDADSPSSIGLLTESRIESRYAEIARDIMRDVYDEMVEIF